MREKIIHIKATPNVDDGVISELMNILIKYKFKTEKYSGMCSKTKIVMARKEENVK